LEEEEFEIAVCDETGEGFSTFDLTQIETEIESDDTTMFFYFLTEEDAVSGSNIIMNPTDFTNEEEGGQTIYIRVENQEGCYSIAEVELIIESAPTSDLEEVTLHVCVTEENEGVIFDLTQAEDMFFEDLSGLNFLYFESIEDAENGVENIIETENYETSEETTVYVKIYDLEEDCYTVYPIHLQYDEPPTIENVEDIEVCGNEVFVFDLTQNEDMIIGNQEGVEVLYFTNEEDANSAENPIENPQEYNTAETGCEFIYVRLQTEGDSDCFSIAEFQVCGFEIEVNSPENLVVCEIDFYDDFAVFDLTENTEQILAGQDLEDFQISYYHTAEDAEMGENEILSPENYETDQNENIYFKAETTAECFAIGSFELIIIETTIVNLEEVMVCEGEKLNLFEILAEENIEIVDFYTSLENLAENISISSPEEYVVDHNSTEIYIKVIEAEEDCAVLYKIHLTLEECELFIPEGFSPNGDGKNDLFEISGLENHNYTLKVYSRYGVLLYEGNQDKEFWDGSAKNGNRVPSGTYYYVLKSNKIEKDIKGWVYLNR